MQLGPINQLLLEECDLQKHLAEGHNIFFLVIKLSESDLSECFAFNNTIELVFWAGDF